MYTLVLIPFQVHYCMVSANEHLSFFFFKGREISKGEGERERKRKKKMSLQTQVATLFFSRGNSLKLKLNLKLMKHILEVAFVSEVINYLYQL